MIAAVPPELIVGAIVLVVILSLARWGWNARRREAAVLAWLEQAKREQEGRERFDATLEKSSGGLGRRILADRLRKPPKR